MVTAARCVQPLARGFPPIGDPRARILILGSLPGEKSIKMSQYYAHAQNGFWKIMGVLFDAEPALPYAARLERLIVHRVAVWDVLAAGERAGSLDSEIVTASIVVNDFEAFFGRHRAVRLICFNGAKAAQLYRRNVLPVLEPEFAALDTRVLPSTSPANASIRFEDKLARWSSALTSVAPER
ncbi:MAG TPA: DNA-deoxyinosine glycosylase [Gammaproteobacteria bacterium]|nr:DNA-deoxyinosine glycosylase [Gammaproteobacteria bacterium]